MVNSEYSKYLKNFNRNPPASPSSLAAIQQVGGVPLPSDYLAFLAEVDGGEGFIGENYLMLWRADELISFNQDNKKNQYAPGLFVIGSTGGGEAFAYDLADPASPIVQVPFIPLDRECMEKVETSFLAFIKGLSET